ncbi:MAG: hypothetical protein J0L92_37645, partial [Deltaproteobacteria bacterium]|nr:hypothetical protein [Deltaproteobacteria bacterium]
APVVKRQPDPAPRAKATPVTPASPFSPTAPPTPSAPITAPAQSVVSHDRARASAAGRPSPLGGVKPAGAANGPRYFFAASDDWPGASDRIARSNVASGASLPPPSATPLSSVPLTTAPAAATAMSAPSLGSASTTGSGLPRVHASAERAVADLASAARESAPRPTRDEVAVKGALVVALLDHLETELGSAESAHTLASIEPSQRQKLEGVILPMAWLPLSLFESLLSAMDRDHPDPLRAIASGRAAAERELSTTHRLFLQTATPTTVLDRLPHLHRVYFSRGEARVAPVANGTRVEVEGLGVESAALLGWLSGFWQRMLELAGARDVKVVATTSRARGDERSSVTLRWR